METKKRNSYLNQKLIVIGLDGATFDIIYPMIEKGRLPTISNLIQTGTHGVLKSTIPDLSPVAWTSMVTGKKPGHHAIFDFITRQAGTYNFKSARGGDRKVTPIWTMLSDAGKNVGVINVTMSYPPERVNGVIISGIDSPGVESNFTHPPGLHQEIKENIGCYVIVNPYASTNREKHLQGMFEMLDNRLATTKYLMKRYEWDFFMSVFIATDGAQHFYWKDMDLLHPDHKPQTPEPFKNAIFNVYEKLDKGIAEMLELCEEEITVMLVSDHGFAPLNKVFVLNNWLLENGYLCLKGNFRCSKNLKKLASFGKKIKNRLLHRGPKKFEESRYLHQSIDWKQTKAFAEGKFGYIYINLKGREPEGIVNPGGEYDELCETIIQKLNNVKDPENAQQVVDKVYTRKETFGETFIDNAPDLIVTSRQPYFVSASMERLPGKHYEKSGTNGLFKKHVWSGNHAPDGIFIINGPGIRKGHTVKDADIIDIVPTALYLMGQEIPDDLDGKILSHAFSNEYRERYEPRFAKRAEISQNNKSSSDGLNSEEDELIKQRLRNLGYF